MKILVSAPESILKEYELFSNISQGESVNVYSGRRKADGVLVRETVVFVVYVMFKTRTAVFYQVWKFQGVARESSDLIKHVVCFEQSCIHETWMNERMNEN